MTTFIWAIIAAGLVLFGLKASRMARQQDQDNLADMGHAILEFGRAYPQEAIRALHSTADGQTVFVRLHDNKAGIMRSLRGHYSCHLIEPGTVRVSPSASGRGLQIEFLDTRHHTGTYEFARPDDAAEVSLWLLGALGLAGEGRLPREGAPA